MTQHSDKVEQQREILKTEALDKKIISIDIRPGRIQTWYNLGAWWQSIQEISVEKPRLIIEV